MARSLRITVHTPLSGLIKARVVLIHAPYQRPVYISKLGHSSLEMWACIVQLFRVVDSMGLEMNEAGEVYCSAYVK
jgi:hypothetical protein